MPASPPRVPLCSRYRGWGGETSVVAHGLGRRVPPRVMCGVPWQTGARAEKRSKFKKAMIWGTEHLTSGPPLLSFHLASWVNHVASGTLPSPLGHLGSPHCVRLVLSPFCHPWVRKSTGLLSLLPSLPVPLGIAHLLQMAAKQAVFRLETHA